MQAFTFNQNFIFAIGIVLASILVFSCDTKSSIQFSGDRSTPNTSQVPIVLNPALEVTGGGAFQKVTSGGYKVSTSLGTKTKSVAGVTSGGYKVQMNIQGEMAQ